jgi:hypothetical protein
MTFKPGLELLEASFFEAASGTLSAITFIEGPEKEEQFTLRVSTLLDREVRPYEIEVISPLFPAFNNAAHENQELVSMVGVLKTDFTISATRTSLWLSEQELSGTPLPALELSGSIYPSPGSHLRILIDYKIAGFAGPVVASVRRLGDGFMMTSAWLVATIAGGMLLMTGGFLAHAKVESDRRHLQIMEAMRTCVSYTSNSTIKLSIKPHAKVTDSEIHSDLSLQNNGRLTVHKKA